MILKKKISTNVEKVKVQIFQEPKLKSVQRQREKSQPVSVTNATVVSAPPKTEVKWRNICS